MAKGEHWSRLEVEACVADYLTMLTLELNGQRYSKTQHANALLEKLDGRSRQSLEFKHCNISAVMLALGFPYIDGYKPRGNFQGMLLEVVEAQVQTRVALQEAAQAAVVRPATAVAQADNEAVWVDVPKPTRIREAPASYVPRFSPAKRDYLAQEARNRSLGRAGELFVLELEARRLHAAGKKALSERVEHVAATQGDGLGFDVLSYEESGRERLIEVKTTAFGQLTPFFVSRNELTRSEADAERYHLYRVFDFRNKARLFRLPGAISASCTLEATTYLARLGE
ncbi:MAG TPA: DUF3883 domain-containing protein [Frateuria sp.]|uniref:DUF3883 domain-containing protein n=1 Tax=Frateuria sp. TaxID=2211372 RepID=UPI002DE2667E|nr:DUF3883 domain-containing protein [Frateuria sp.]